MLHDAGKKALTVVCADGPNISLEYPTLLESHGRTLERVPPRDSMLGDFSTHLGNDGDTFKLGEWEERSASS